QEPDQDGDDRDHHQQLDQREAAGRSPTKPHENTSSMGEREEPPRMPGSNDKTTPRTPAVQGSERILPFEVASRDRTPGRRTAGPAEGPGGNTTSPSSACSVPRRQEIVSDQAVPG